MCTYFSLLLSSVTSMLINLAYQTNRNNKNQFKERSRDKHNS